VRLGGEVVHLVEVMFLEQFEEAAGVGQIAVVVLEVAALLQGCEPAQIAL